jgi:AraC-like DNA-binding protein
MDKVLDALNDSDQLIAVNYSNYNLYESGTKYALPDLTLAMACDSGQAKVLMNSKGYLVSDSSRKVEIGYRLDDKPATNARWPSQQSAAGLFGKKAEIFMREIASAETMFIRLSEQDGDRHEANVLLAGVGDIVDEIGALCGFSTLELSREDFQEIQTLLNAAGFNAGAPDGMWGSGSKRAMRDFQKSNGIEPTGIVDRTTLATLGL